MPPVNLIGAGAAKEVGARCKTIGGKKALLVTDSELVKVGIPDEVAANIKDAGLDVVTFAGAQPNPTDTNVNDGLKVFKKEKCDLIVSVGGGSAHDCAKGIGLLAGNGGNIKDFAGLDMSK